MIYSLVAIAVFLVILTMIVLSLPVFGKLPEGSRLERIQKMGNYKDGALQNLSFTPVKPDNVSWSDMIKRMIKGNENSSPKKALPHVIPDFSKTEDAKLIWFGHSSYLLQVDGLNILVDPVFSSRTSPFSFIGSKNFPGTDFVKAEDFPELDIVLLTHDHYDHLDYPTILKIKDKTKHFVTSLGVGEHLEKWGIASSKITELSWSEEIIVNGLKFIYSRATFYRSFF